MLYVGKYSYFLTSASKLHWKTAWSFQISQYLNSYVANMKSLHDYFGFSDTSSNFTGVLVFVMIKGKFAKLRHPKSDKERKVLGS